MDLAGTTGGAVIENNGLSGALVFTSDFTASGVGTKTLTLAGSNTGANAIQGVIVDNAPANPTALAKTGNGTWIVSGANTFTGATTVTNGTLLVNNSSGSGTGGGTVTVDAGGTLGGTGSISGATAVNGYLTPGNGAGNIETLAFGNTLNLSNAQKTTFDIAGATTRGTSYDGIDATGTLTYGGVLELNFTNVFAGGTYNFDLFNLGGSQAGSFSAVNLIGSYTGSLVNNGSGVWSLSAGGNSWQFTQTSGDLAFTAVPEPGGALVGALITLGLYRRKRHD